MPDVEQNSVRYQATVLDRPGRGLRYMHRRRVNTTDRNGDPLDGIVNLFDVAIVLAIGFLLAALTGLGLSDMLSSKNMTVVKNPGQADMQVIVKQGDSLQTLDLKAGQQVSGLGQLIGQFYRLQDGTTVYVPTTGTGTGTTPSSTGSGTTPSTTGTGTTTTPGTTGTGTDTTTPGTTGTGTDTTTPGTGVTPTPTDSTLPAGGVH
jgi:hypothetical protein